MRILPDGKEVRDFKAIGYSDAQIQRLNNALLAPNGLILTSGAMNSGKSTLQTALIMALKNHRLTQYKKVLEIGSPIEFIIDVDGVTQRSIHTTVGMSEAERTQEFDETAENALRSDSQVFCLNEIRNKQTAEFALRTTESGHLFLSTVHALNALGIVKRLVGFGLPREAICSPEMINLLTHQSLVSTVCSHCAYDYQATCESDSEEDQALIGRLNKVFEVYGFAESLKDGIRFRNHAGCQHCSKGLTGLTVVAEMVEMNTEILSLLSENKEIEAYKTWRNMGERTCKEDGILKMLKGEVSPCSLELNLGRLNIFPLMDVLKDELVKSLFDDAFLVMKKSEKVDVNYTKDDRKAVYQAAI